MVVGITKGNNLVLYDIINFKNDYITPKFNLSNKNAVTETPSQATRREATETVSNNSIRNSPENVNTKNENNSPVRYSFSERQKKEGLSAYVKMCITFKPHKIHRFYGDPEQITPRFL